jgi:hypothetical protein
MEKLAALGLAGNVVQFIDFAGKLFVHIKEYSSDASKAPRSVQALVEHLNLVLNTLKELNGASLTSIESERIPIQLCITQAEALNTFLDKFKVNSHRARNGSTNISWIDRRRAGFEKKKHGKHSSLCTARRRLRNSNVHSMGSLCL